MKRILLSIFVVTIILVVARLTANRFPVKLEGIEWQSIEKCAENQKKLYQSIEWFVRENGDLPTQDFEIRGFPARDMWKCPISEQGYTIRVENYGNPQAVIIADEQDKHPTTLMWWLRGLHPNVQTMGDGTIQLFKDGKVLTMVGSEK